MHNVAQWLWRARLSPQIELVLAAPAVVLSWIAGRLIPPRVRIASAIGARDRKAIRVAGAVVTTGLIVIVVDCNEDFASKTRDPFSDGGEPSDPIRREVVRWAGQAEPGGSAAVEGLPAARLHSLNEQSQPNFPT